MCRLPAIGFADLLGDSQRESDRMSFLRSADGIRTDRLRRSLGKTPGGSLIGCLFKARRSSFPREAFFLARQAVDFVDFKKSFLRKLPVDFADLIERLPFGSCAERSERPDRSWCQVCPRQTYDPFRDMTVSIVIQKKLSARFYFLKFFFNIFA